MSTLHRLAETAVRRDLQRSRVVLASASPLRANRRIALCDHLIWMAELVGGGADVVQNAACQVRGTAREFRDEGDRASRTALVGALGSMLRVAERHECWIARAAAPALAHNLPWLVDGVSGHPGTGLSSAEDRMRTRIRAEQYRHWRIELWGPIALATGARILVR